MLTHPHWFQQRNSLVIIALSFHATDFSWNAINSSFSPMIFANVCSYLLFIQKNNTNIPRILDKKRSKPSCQRKKNSQRESNIGLISMNDLFWTKPYKNKDKYGLLQCSAGNCRTSISFYLQRENRTLTYSIYSYICQEFK